MTDLETCSRCGKPSEIYAKRRKLCKPCYPLDLEERKAQATPLGASGKPKPKPQPDAAGATTTRQRRSRIACEVKRAPVFVKTRERVEAECECGLFDVTVPCGSKPAEIAAAIEKAKAHLDFHISRSSTKDKSA
jgi:hypothetical protein